MERGVKLLFVKKAFKATIWTREGGEKAEEETDAYIRKEGFCDRGREERA